MLRCRQRYTSSEHGMMLSKILARNRRSAFSGTYSIRVTARPLPSTRGLHMPLMGARMSLRHDDGRRRRFGLDVAPNKYLPHPSHGRPERAANKRQ